MIKYNKPKNVSLHLEDFIPNKSYAFTISPEIQLFGDPNRFQLIQDHIMGFLESEYAEYKLYTELSTFGNIHYHGYIRILDPLRFVLHDIQNLISNGTMVIKEIDNDEIWENYIIKQLPAVRRKVLIIAKKQQKGVETKSYLANRHKEIFRDRSLI